MASKESLRERFKALVGKRQYGEIKMGKDMSEMLAFIDSCTKKEFESFSLLSTICGGERRIKVSPQFESTFLALSLEEKVAYYEGAVNSLLERQRETSIQFLTENEVEFQILPIRVLKGLKIGPNYKLKLPAFLIDCAHYEISLANYLLRRSKKSNQVFIFESLAQQEPQAIRFEIAAYSQSKDAALVSENNRNWRKYIYNLNKVDSPPNPKVKLSKHPKEGSEAGSPTKKSVTNLEVESRVNLSPDPHFETDPLERSVIHEVFHTNDDNIEEEIYDLIELKELELSKRTSKSTLRHFRKNVARIILPTLSLLEIENFNDYLPVVRDEAHRLYIFQHLVKKSQFRMELYIKQREELVVRHLCEVQNYKLWNDSINESNVKLSISSDNAYLVYLKQRAYSNVYRERDFLFLRHLCKVGEASYFLDTSIENSHFIPFTSILRGTINYCVTKVEQFNENESRLLMELNIDHGGLLQLQGQVHSELTLRYLREFVALESYITRFKGDFKNPYDLNWEISPTDEQVQVLNSLGDSRLSVASNVFEQPLSSMSIANNDEDDFYSIADEESPLPTCEITEEELKQEQLKLEKAKEMQISYTSEVIELNAEGLVILPNKYVKVRHAIAPIKLEGCRKKNPFANLMLKNDFVMDNGGGMKLANEVKAAAQNNVIKFIMSTLKKNLFSGKGFLNISLPVEIFNSDSNIQRLCESLSVAPDLIERKAANPVERFKNCVAFAFTNSVLYFDIDKAFNPILGESFQGFIDGCPVYGEQISHHPPISSILFIGRGYRIYGNVEAKVYVHLNSGEGVNEGFYTVEFDDGEKVVYQTAPGEVSGLTMGDRKFRFKGKTFVMDAKNRLFCAINFEDESGMFSKSKWKFSDQVEGEIVRVSETFVRHFFESKEGKDAICPCKKDIEERFGKISGRWLDSFKIDGQEYFNLRYAPHEMIHYEYALNSNSDYRQDLLYRKRNDLARSQNEKERLEILQRNDRKLREKYHPKKH